MRPDSQDEPRKATPWWETLVIAGSFLLLWAWWLARQAALRANETPSFWWQAVMGLALLALLFVMARRTQRVVRALRGQDEEDLSPPHGKPM